MMSKPLFLLLPWLAASSCLEGACEYNALLQVKHTQSYYPTQDEVNEAMDVMHDHFGSNLSPEEISALHTYYEDLYEKANEEAMQFVKANSSDLLQTSSVAGFVKELYTFGAPGSGSPGLRPKHGSCYAGKRMYSSNGKESDPIAFLTNSVWFWHPQMDTIKFDISDPSKDVHQKCPKPDLKKQPPWEPMFLDQFDLHKGETYKKAVERDSYLHNEAGISDNELAAFFDASYESFTIPGCKYIPFFRGCSKKLQPKDVQETVSKIGWNVVGAAKVQFDGVFGFVTGGTGISYLLQETKSLDCVITFQGTSSTRDWIADAGALAVPYCGLTESGDTCERGLADCKPKGNGISFVHLGFRQNLKRMVSSEAFKQNLHAKLPYCKSVSVFGHSLGGAMAELFTACAGQHLVKGNYGYDDYANVGWSEEKPELLPPRPTFEVQ